MYSVIRKADEQSAIDGQQGEEETARRHKDISPELKEVMHLLKAMESGEGIK